MSGTLPSGMPAIEPIELAARPFWSVMIPSYNNPDLLARTLESVLAQDPGPDVMHIEVVDDASGDGAIRDVVARVGAGRVGLFVQPRNVGASANFTTCVRRSIGTWVHVLHSDDVVLPTFYARYGDHIATCPDAVMVAGQTIYVDSAERYVGITPSVAVEDGYLRDAAFAIVTANPVRCVSVVASRTAYEQVGGFHPHLFHTNDWEMWSRLAGHGPVAWVGEPLGLYRLHEASDTSRLHRSTAYLDDCLQAVEVMSRRIEPARRRQARRGGRESVAVYALSVSDTLVDEGWFRLAVVNAARGARLAPSLDIWSRALGVTKRAVDGRLHRRATPDGEPGDRTGWAPGG